MNVKKILTNAVLIVIAGGLIGLCIATHVLDDLMAMIGIGLPVWAFLILIALIVNVVYQAKILQTLRSIHDQGVYVDPPQSPDEEVIR